VNSLETYHGQDSEELSQRREEQSEDVGRPQPKQKNSEQLKWEAWNHNIRIDVVSERVPTASAIKNRLTQSAIRTQMTDPRNAATLTAQPLCMLWRISSVVLLVLDDVTKCVQHVVSLQ